MEKVLTKNIRNVCLLGHSADGKTSLAEAMLYLTKGTDRLGNPTDGNTVCDYDPEEIKRGFSLSASVAPVNYKGTKINNVYPIEVLPANSHQYWTVATDPAINNMLLGVSNHTVLNTPQEILDWVNSIS